MGCWHVTHRRIERTDLILCSILLCIDSVEHFCHRVGGWIESMGSTRLNTRHKALHPAVMWPCSHHEGPEWCMLFISSVKLKQKLISLVPQVSLEIPQIPAFRLEFVH